MKTTAPATKAHPSMPQPIRVLHFAALHLGAQAYGKPDAVTGLHSRVQDSLQRMDEMIDFAEAEAVDVVVFAGDAFHSRRPSPTLQRAFAQRILRLSRLAPTLLLVGAGDRAAQQSKAATIEIYHTLQLPNIWVARAFDLRRIQTKRGDLLLAAAPFISRAELQTEPPDTGTDALQQALAGRYQALSARANALAGTEDPPRLLCAHVPLPESAATAPASLGRDLPLDPAALRDGGWDYVALGHDTRHQHFAADNTPVVISGSLERASFAEERLAKGFCWLELQRGCAQWRFIEQNARAMRSLDLDVRGAQNPSDAVLQALKAEDLRDAILQLQIRLRAEQSAFLDERRILAALRTAAVFHIAGLHKQIEQEKPLHLGSSLEDMSALELLGRYLHARKVDAQRRDELLQLARKFLPAD